MLVDDYFAKDNRKYKATYYVNSQFSMSIEARKYWVKLAEADNNHQFLKDRKIEAFGLRQNEKVLFLPARDGTGSITTLMGIAPDGRSRFMKGGKVIGSSYRIGDVRPHEYVFFCEDFASAATIHMATQAAVVVVLANWNFMPVVKCYQHNLKTGLMIMADAADPDGERDLNEKSAYQVIQGMGCKLIRPMFKEEMVSKSLADRGLVPTTWNDLLLLGGMEEVKAQLFTLDVQWPASPVAPAFGPRKFTPLSKLMEKTA